MSGSHVYFMSRCADYAQSEVFRDSGFALLVLVQ